MPSFVHDSLFKFYMQDIEFAKAFIVSYFAPDEVLLMNLATLKLEPVEMIGRHLRKSVVDILYSVKSRDKDYMIYILLEHQSTPDRLMPIRLNEYSMSILRKHYRSSEIQAMVLPMVVYAGIRPYKTLSFHNYMLRGDRLLDLCRLDKQAILKNSSTALMLLALKLRAESSVSDFLSLIKVKDLKKELACTDLNPLLLYIMDDSSLCDKDALLEAFSGHMEEEFMTSYIGRLVDESYKKGSMQGYEKGSKQGYEKGSKQGYEKGSKLGYEKGSKQGYEKGSKQGYEKGSKAGYDRGSKIGFAEGNKKGFRSAAKMLLSTMSKQEVASALDLSLDEIESIMNHG